MCHRDCASAVSGVCVPAARAGPLQRLPSERSSGGARPLPRLPGQGRQSGPRPAWQTLQLRGLLRLTQMQRQPSLRAAGCAGRPQGGAADPDPVAAWGLGRSVACASAARCPPAAEPPWQRCRAENAHPLQPQPLPLQTAAPALLALGALLAERAARRDCQRVPM